jgi:xanthine dehydrogenase accessory factor
MNVPVPEILRHAASLQETRRPVVACLVVGAQGSTPQSAGALMIVDDTLATLGTIGGGCVEAEVRRRAHGLLSDGTSGVMRFKLDHDHGWDDGMICGGTLVIAIGPLPDAATLRGIAGDVDARQATSLAVTVEADQGPVVYRLQLPPRERLYVAGVGHIGQAAARLALRLEFEVTIFDDRPELLERYTPDGVTPQPGDVAEQLAAAPIDGDTYCLVVTRGHRHDGQALAAVVGRGARYVGMIGSRRKVKLIFDELVAAGVAREELDSVAAPVGLDIDAVSVEEIAVSIAAQLVQQRGARREQTVTGPLPVPAATPLS